MLEYTHISEDFGRIYWVLEEERNLGYKVVGNDFPARLFVDKTRRAKDMSLHPDG